MTVLLVISVCTLGVIFMSNTQDPVQQRNHDCKDKPTLTDVSEQGYILALHYFDQITVGTILISKVLCVWQRRLVEFN